MKDSAAERLRENWKERGDPPCTHADVECEIGFSGVPTGYLACRRCGAQLR